MVHDGEELVLGNAGLDRLAHGRHRRLGASHRGLQALHFLRRLYRANREDLALAVLDLAVALFQRQRLQMAAAVEAEFHRAGAMLLQQLGDLVCEWSGGLVVAAGH